MNFSASPATYCLGENARDTLVLVYSWTISDGGLDSECPCPGYTEYDGTDWDSGAPDLTTTAAIGQDYDSDLDGGGFSACDLEVLAGATLIVRPGDTIHVAGSLSIMGDIMVHDGGYVELEDN